jgi:hypothetical protein
LVKQVFQKASFDVAQFVFHRTRFQ